MSNSTYNINDLFKNSDLLSTQNTTVKFWDMGEKANFENELVEIKIIDSQSNISQFSEYSQLQTFQNKFDEIRNEFGKKFTITDYTKPFSVTKKIYSMGEKSNQPKKDFINLGGKIIGDFVSSKAEDIIFYLDNLSGDEVAQLVYGALLRSYRFDKYKQDKKDEKTKAINIHIVSSNKDQAKLFEPYFNLVLGEFVARDLVSEPANILYPDNYAKRCKLLEKTGLKVKILGEKEMEKLGMGSLLGVGQGSVRESKIVVMEHMLGGNEEVFALAGKGVCFDTGGISLKPAPSMDEMKWDMGGSASVVGTMTSLALNKIKKNVVGIIGLVENMPDGNAQRPGDVVTSMSGQTIEVLNTDAEGRLVLADVLTYVQKTYKPSKVIDLATLTGAIIISLGEEFAGIFSNCDNLTKDLLQASKNTEQKLWHMPLTKEHDKSLKSPIADMQNIGQGRGAGSSVAAAFLQRFVEKEVSWAHLDIAGVAWNKKGNDTTPKGGTGYGVRLLFDLINK